jgi:hypothetical protein
MPTQGGAERIPGQSVTSEFFSTLGVRPIAGRTFNEDDVRARAAVVVLSERMWRNRFGADVSLIGRPIPLDGRPFTVIGVVPADFEILYPADQWTLFIPRRSPEQRRMHYLQVIGRLKPGITPAQANAAMSAIGLRIAEISPATNKGWGLRWSLYAGPWWGTNCAQLR